jgi:hypothetical protein
MKKIQIKYKFLILVIIIYTITAFINLELIKTSFTYFLKIFSEILWIFLIVFILMIAINLFWNQKSTKKYL